jgi:uncharacterized protein YkwD
VGFLQKSLSALFAFLFLLSAGGLATSVNAQEASNLGNIQGKEGCPVSQFLITSSDSCSDKPKLSQTQEFLPTQTLISLKNLDKKRTKKEQSSQQIIKLTIKEPSVEATLSADILFSLVNTHREQIGLPYFQKDPQVCSVAEARRKQIRTEIFLTHALHEGFYAMDLSFWATENMIWQHTEAEALSWWLHSPVHRSAIEGDYKYACGVCNGQVCNMVFTNYEPKVKNYSQKPVDSVFAKIP